MVFTIHRSLSEAFHYNVNLKNARQLSAPLQASEARDPERSGSTETK